MTDVQLVNGMDHTNFEDAVKKAVAKRIGGDPDVLESDTYGVVPIVRLEGTDAAKVVWEELAAELVRETGVGITCIANCDWTVPDSHDEEATYIAFACPGVPEDLAHSEYRNHLDRPLVPGEVPSQQDFDDARRARRIVAEHLRELDARRGKLIAAGKSDHAATDEYVTVEELKDLKASDREAVKAVLELDFARAVASMAKEPEAPTPGM